MKKTIFLGLFLAFAAVKSSSAENYTKVPLWGGDVQVISVCEAHPEVVYVGSGYNGTFVTRDGGASWVSDKFDGQYGNSGVSTLCVDPTDPALILAGSWGVNANTVYRSEDYGATWTNASQNIMDLSIAKIAASRKTPGRFYMAGTETGPNAVVYRSDDGGASWGNKKTVVASKYATGLAVDGNDALYVTAQNYGDIYHTSDLNGYFYKSTDYGDNWTQKLNFNFWPDSIQVASGTVLINANTNTPGSTGLSEVSNDSGETFIPATPYTTYRAGRFLSSDGKKMYFYGSIDNGTNRALYVSSAPAWNSFAVVCGSTPVSYTPMGAKPGTVFPFPGDDTKFYLTNSELGVLKSTDSGATWQEANNGMGGVMALDGCKDSAGNMYIIGNITLYKGVNIGAGDESWKKVACIDELGGGGPNVGGIVVAPSSSVVLYASRGNFFRSADGGQTWQSVMSFSFGSGGISDIACNKSDPAVCYMSYSKGEVASPSSGKFLYKSTNGGAAWTQQDLTGNSIQALALDPSDPTILYAGLGDPRPINDQAPTTYGGMWKIVDDGINPPVKTQLAGLDDYMPYKIAVDTGGIVFAACRNAGDHVLMYSKDGGATWNRSVTDFNGINDVAFSQGVYYVSNAQGIYASRVIDRPFGRLASSSDIGNVWCLIVGSMYGGSDSGVYKMTSSAFAALGINAKAYNYPNPFNPKNGDTTIIRYLSTALPSSVTVKIYTVSGELVWDYAETTVDGKVTWDGKNKTGGYCAPGVYIAVVDMDGTKARNKIVLVY
jgi:photosystem II stability/assembly factor-like uncharacterized protein